MARDFSGTGEFLTGGSDASIDNFVAITMAWDVRDDAVGAGDVVAQKGTANTDGYRVLCASGFLQFVRVFSGAVGVWNGDASTDGQHHCVLSHDGTTADPRMVVDGAVNTITVAAAPSGTLVADASSALRIGRFSSGTNELDGAVQNFCLANEVWTPAMENRHHWWGVAPGGPSTVKVWYPFYTESLVNKGTATDTLTATGTTVVSMPTPTVRPGSALMGMGVGW